MVAEGVKLPGEGVLLRRDGERVAENGCAAGGGGAQLDDLGTESDGVAVAVLCPVVQCDL